MHHAQSNCGRECREVCGNLWSKAHKIRMLQKRLDVLEDQKKEIETLIRELKEE